MAKAVSAAAVMPREPADVATTAPQSQTEVRLWNSYRTEWRLAENWQRHAGAGRQDGKMQRDRHQLLLPVLTQCAAT